MARMSYRARLALVIGLVSSAALVAACSSDSSANDTLPPISTTSTTTTMPATTTTIPQVYVVRKGDSLFSIAKKFGISAADLAAFNNITDPDKIQAGQKLNLPQQGETVTLPPTTAPTTPVTTAPVTTSG
ncbi:unannotated protein [freshwater metagenome]|uniref:Unannotated protein n=1 Tax=freshwater metagenome TaxID=449393 RepID=A0A6J7CG84_9ZZZZ